MHPSGAPPSSSDVVSEGIGLSVGLGILTMALFPFALPLLLLCVAPLVLIAVPALLLAGLVVLPLRLARSLGRALSRRPRAPGLHEDASLRTAADARH